MPKSTGETIEKNAEKKLDKIVSKKRNKKNKQIKNKSVQNKVIENIKSFISKILEMQEKVKQDEDEEKREKAEEKREKKELKEKKEKKSNYLIEYYDLPYRYNETVVKILAQTPKRLFVYWDISDKDRTTYLNAFGENFFNDTYPVLLLHNENKNYTKEIEINDFANSWYLDISDPRDNYTIQLGRKFKSYIKPKINSKNVNTEEKKILLQNDYLFIAISNKLEVPNDHILFEEIKPYVKYRDVKTNKEEIKELKTTVFKDKVKNFYKQLYKESDIVEDKFDLSNPSSMGTSSSIAK